MRKATFFIALLITLAKAEDKNEKYCWSKELYKINCCHDGTLPNYFDADGSWYLSYYGAKCGIYDGNCWSRFFGYPCCELDHSDDPDITTDSHGSWAKEKGNYCGIRDSLKPWNDREVNESTRKEWEAFKNEWDDDSVKYNFERLSVFVGDNESEINFGWYSATKNEAEIRISKYNNMSNPITFTGTSESQSDYNIDHLKLLGTKYYTNRVTVTGIEPHSVFYYQRKLNGKWETPVQFNTFDDKNFSFIFFGDPQIGGSHGRLSKANHYRRVVSDEESNRNDAFNWNRAVVRAFNYTRNPSVLISVGDQVDEACNFEQDDYQDQIVNAESQYSGFLYPELMKHIVSATCVGNHEQNIASFGRHFNVPNPMKDSSITKRFGGWYPGYNYFFKYNNVLVVVLESNFNNEDDNKKIFKNAILKYPETDWRVALFHHDIFGNGATHSQSDSLSRRDDILRLITSYKFDLVINGHDHVYTTSKYVTYDVNDPKNYKISEIDVNEPNKVFKGTLFVTANCATGAKYLDIVKDNLDYVYNTTQSYSSTFGVINFAQKNKKVQLSLTTYEVETYNVVDGPYKFEKTIGSRRNKCWSEKESGYPCCPPGTEIAEIKDGKEYGYYLDNYCGIVSGEIEETTIVELKTTSTFGPRTTTEPIPTVTEFEPIYSSIIDIEPIPTNTVETEPNQPNFTEFEPIYTSIIDIEPLNKTTTTEPVQTTTEEPITTTKTLVEPSDITKITTTEPVQTTTTTIVEPINKTTTVEPVQTTKTSIVEPFNQTTIIEPVQTTTVKPIPITTTEPIPITSTKPIQTTTVEPVTTILTITESVKVTTTTLTITTTTEPNVTEVPDPCWSKKLGFDCCTQPNPNVVLIDGDGEWGVENEQWCGIIKECWSKKLGFECCSQPNPDVVYTDDDGEWGVENEQWCGIIKNTTRTTTTTTTTSPTTTTVITITFTTPIITTTTTTTTTTPVITTTTTTTTTTPDVTTTTTTTTVSDEHCANQYEQCGGIDHRGPTCCKEGFVCYGETKYYAQCIVKFWH